MKDLNHFIDEQVTSLTKTLQANEGIYLGTDLLPYVKQFLTTTLKKRDEEMAQTMYYPVDVDKEPTIQDEAYANQFESKAQAFWYGEAQAMKHVAEVAKQYGIILTQPD